MLMDAQGNMDKRRVVAAAAATAGIEFTPEQIRGLSSDQVRQILAMVNQRNGGLNPGSVPTSLAMSRHSGGVQIGEGQTPSNVAASVALSAASIGNYMGQFGNSARANAAQGHMGAAHNQALSQAIAFEKQKHLQQQVRQQQMQQASGPHAAVATAQGKRNAAVASAAGVTVPQLNAIFASQKAKMEKPGATPQEKQAALAEALHNANRVRASQGAGTAAAAHLANGAPSAPVVSGGTAVPASAGVPAQGSPPSVNAAEAEFWAKLEDMQRKYKASLQRLFPIIRRLQERQPPPRQEVFMRHLRDCFNILNLQRSSPIPQRLTTAVLERAERFIHQVVSVYSKYLKDMVQNSGADPARRAQLVAQIDDCTGAVPNAPQQVPNVQAQQGSRVPTQASLQQGKANPNLSQGSAAQLGAQQQQYARFQQQQMHQSQQQILKQMQAQHQQQQQNQSQPPQALPQRPGQTPLGTVPGGDKAVKLPPAKGTPSRGRSSQVKGPQGTQGIPMSASLSNALPGQTPMQARVQAQAQVQAQVHAHVQAQAAAAQAQAQAHAAARAQAALAQAQANSQRMRPVRAAAPGAQSRAVQQHLAQQNINQLRKQQAHSGRMSAQPGMMPNVKQQQGTWGVQPGSAMTGSAQGAAGGSGRPKRPEPSLQQRLQHVEATVKDAMEQAQRLEAYVDAEMKRAKSERIQNTLAALRNNSSAVSAEDSKRRGTKRQASLVDVNNIASKDGLIKSKTVFECSSEAGLRLAKRPKNEAADLRSLREAVEADCKAAKERNPLLMIEVIEEFGQPVVTCLLKIPEIRLPKLVLRVARGYPRKGGCTYGFERPPMGWVGVLDEIRTRFKRALATAPAASVGVAAFLDAWATEADAVINGSRLSDNR